MSLSRYPSYKPSGVEWVGDVPESWVVRPLFGLAAERSEPNVGMMEENLLSLSYGRIVRKDMASNDGLLPESFETYQIVKTGDIVFRLTDLQNDRRSLRTGLVGETGIITSAYVAVTPLGAHARYLAYLFRAYDTGKVFYSMGGGLRQAMKFADLKRLPVLVPSPAEQLGIISFLDRETATIDELVAEQERLIELLKEKRQAVISHAVTKGLNPGAPMKPSGVEWLGDVPAHWEVGRCGRYVEMLSGYPFGSEDFSSDEADTRLLRGINVCPGEIRWDEVVYWKRQAGDDLDAFELQAGDIVVGMDRPLIADGIRVARIGTRDLPCLLLQRVLRLKPRDQMRPEYLIHLLAARTFAAHFAPETTGVSVPHISPGQVASYIVPVPPIQEQISIAAHLDAAAGDLDALISEAESAVSLLYERRSTLISAAVTGQIDVRGIVSKGQTMSAERFARRNA